MIYAIVEISGRQLWVESDHYYQVNHIHGEKNTKILLNKVLLLKDNETVYIGQPYLDSVFVGAQIIEHTTGPKVIVYKMKPKKKTRRKRGHRQKITKIFIDNKITK